MEIEPYEGEILERRRIGNLKVYFAQSNNPKFRFGYDFGLEFKTRQDMVVGKGLAKDIGFAIIWVPRTIIGKVRDEQRGFEIKSYNFPDLKESSFENICQLNAEIIGGESKILRYSNTPQDYLSRFVQQKDFKQRYVWQNSL